MSRPISATSGPAVLSEIRREPTALRALFPHEGIGVIRDNRSLPLIRAGTCGDSPSLFLRLALPVITADAATVAGATDDARPSPPSAAAESLCRRLGAVAVAAP
jgi:hypothetical protein